MVAQEGQNQVHQNDRQLCGQPSSEISLQKLLLPYTSAEPF